MYAKLRQYIWFPEGGDPLRKLIDFSRFDDIQNSFFRVHSILALCGEYSNLVANLIISGYFHLLKMLYFELRGFTNFLKRKPIKVRGMIGTSGPGVILIGHR